MTREKGYKLQTNSFFDFEEHINNSDFIFLSAPFGFGKTTFLKDFIESVEEGSNYNFFHLYPVHYEVNKNEDVFELIKYDLLFEVLKKDNTKEEISIDYSKGVKGILKKNIEAILLSFIEKIPEIGKSLKEIIQAFDKVEKEILELYQQEFKTPEVNSFISRMENTKGSVFEHDIITTYINNKLNEIKGEDGEMKNILILDDLDRIEPEHIFRLLNVFSANFDNSEYSINKFGIDKVIIVADYYNIKSIYHHKYGNGSDFEGYINKFYSDEIYFLTFYDAIKSLFKEDYNLREYPDSGFPNLKINLLTLLFNNKQISFRQIRKVSKMNFNKERNLVEIVDDIVNIFNGDYKDLIKSFNEVSTEKDMTVKESFWKALLEFIIDFYYLNNDLRISKSQIFEGKISYAFSFKEDNKKQKFIPSENAGEKPNVKSFLNLKEVTKSLIWKEFIYVLNLNYQKNS
ncbi:P-loop NTPase fold protein [Tenacibaculum caenipelagi]|uniref:KAP-like P-loop domain-containing protein n=1 Tax=Tenacibaculum caenipelagi TaxID=1325435 RepID=A0A4R6TDD0_9FLAO|nr:P-loop NTPase fold protein [Tenacibaculum caenipelagi]TDQ22800.1 KAP-like P-loop domain-containing protein [Tenacibaculum caenipelagi]